MGLWVPFEEAYGIRVYARREIMGMVLILFVDCHILSKMSGIMDLNCE